MYLAECIVVAQKLYREHFYDENLEINLLEVCIPEVTGITWMVMLIYEIRMFSHSFCESAKIVKIKIFNKYRH